MLWCLEEGDVYQIKAGNQKVFRELARQVTGSFGRMNSMRPSCTGKAALRTHRLVVW